MKKVLMIVSNSFDPDPRVHKEAKSLVKQGYDVEVCCMDRKQKNKNEVIDGIKIIRFNVGKVKNGNPINIYFKLRKFKKKVLNYVKNRKYSNIHCHDLDVLNIGVKIKKLKKIPLIYDSHELFYGLRPQKYINTILEIKEKRLIPYVDRFIQANYERGVLFSARQNVSNNKITIIENFPNKIRDFNKEKNKKIIFQYQGGISEERCVFEIVKAFAKMKKENIELKIYGGKNKYTDKIESYIKQHKLNNVKIMGYLPFSELVEETKKTDVGLISLRKNRLNAIFSAPNKLYDYIASKNIVISENQFGLKERVENDNLGFVCNFENEKEIIHTVKKVIKIKNLKQKQEKAYQKHIEKYNWSNEEKKLLKVYADI